MSKIELVSLVKNSLGKDVSSAQAERVVSAVIKGIKTGVKKSKTLQLIGFGTFKVVSRKGYNPKTGAAIKIKASKTVRFSVGKAFKDVL